MNLIVVSETENFEILFDSDTENVSFRDKKHKRVFMTWTLEEFENAAFSAIERISVILE